MVLLLEFTSVKLPPMLELLLIEPLVALELELQMVSAVKRLFQECRRATRFDNTAKLHNSYPITQCFTTHP